MKLLKSPTLASIISFTVFLSGCSSETTQSNSTTPNPIPGITNADIKLNLQEDGFECELDEIRDDGNSRWVCSQESGGSSREVAYVGPSPQKVEFIRGSVFAMDGILSEEDRRFIGYLASLPYEGSQPEEAKQWALSATESAETTFGDVLTYITWLKSNENYTAGVITITNVNNK